MGKPTVRMERRPDPEPPAMATRQSFNFTLEFSIEKNSAAGVHAVVSEFDKVFSKSEGLLRLEDETGHPREWLVAVKGSKPNDALRGTSNIYSVEMSAFVPLEMSEQQGHGATFLPSNGTLVHLHALRDLNEVTTTDRHNERIAARKITTTTISFTARVFHADQFIGHAERMAQLQGVADFYRSMNAKDGVLVMPGHNSIVQVTEWRPAIDERREILEIVVQCRRFDLPGEEKCEATLTEASNLDITTGELIVNKRGTIVAEELETALARMNTIKRSGMHQGSKLTKFSHTMPLVIGADTEYQEQWGGNIEFEMEYRTQSGQCVGYEIKISSDLERNGGSYRRSYSGFVTAATLSAAETKAHELGWGKHPRWTRSNETSTEINAKGKTDQDLEQCERTFTRLEFSYEYELVPDYLEAEFTMTRNKVSYGERTASISGSFVATDHATADAFQEVVIPSLIPDLATLSAVAREGRITAFSCQESNIVKHIAGVTTSTLLRRTLEFGVRVYDRGSTAHIKYSRGETINHTTLTADVSASGTIWADTEAIAKSAYANLKSSLTLGILTQEKVDTEVERLSGQADNFVSINFQVSGQRNVAGELAWDILEAQWSLSRTGQINHAILTEIPRANPVVQVNMGWTIGTMRVQGSVKAKSATSARLWAQEKISLITAGNGSAYQTQAPEETLSPSFLSRSGTEVTTWTFQFSYARSYTQGLEGIWRA